MVEAVRAGWNAYLTDPTPTNAAMAQLNKAMDAQTLLASARAQVELIRTHDIKKLGEMSLLRWQVLVDQLTQLKVIRGQVNPQELFVDR